MQAELLVVRGIEAVVYDHSLLNCSLLAQRILVLDVAFFAMEYDRTCGCFACRDLSASSTLFVGFCLFVFESPAVMLQQKMLVCKALLGAVPGRRLMGCVRLFVMLQDLLCVRNTGLDLLAIVCVKESRRQDHHGVFVVEGRAPASGSRCCRIWST